jgi:hypothetical protein
MEWNWSRFIFDSVPHQVADHHTYIALSSSALPTDISDSPDQVAQYYFDAPSLTQELDNFVKFQGLIKGTRAFSMDTLLI